MTDYRHVVADVSTQTPPTGNQIAVFSDARGLGTKTVQALAREVGFSKTVLVLPAEQGGTARMRIFNPLAEMPFAGHPVLGTAFVIGGPLQREVIELEKRGPGSLPSRSRATSRAPPPSAGCAGRFRRSKRSTVLTALGIAGTA